MLGNNFGPQKNQMHPSDVRNLFIFFVIAIVMFLFYDAYVLQPRAEHARQQRIEQLKEMAAEEAVNPLEAPVEELRPRAEVINETPRVAIDNGRVKGSISLRGARIDDLALEEYYQTLEKKDFVVLLSPKETKLPRYAEFGWVAAEGSTVALPGTDTLWTVRGNNKLTPQNPVTLVWDNGQGLTFERTLSIDENYMIDVKQSVTNNSGRPATLHSYGLITQTGIPEGIQGSWLLIEGLIGYMGDKLHEVAYKKFFKERAHEFEAAQGWAGINDKYWLAALIPPQGEQVRYSFKYTGPTPTKERKTVNGRFQVDFTGPAVTIAPGQKAETKSELFAGAKKFMLLQQYEKERGIPKFDLAVNFGWFWFFAQPFFYALHFLGHWFGNFGVAIIVFTFMIRGAVFPLTNTSYKSFAKMKKVTPQVNALREAHGADRAGLQRELVKLYEREGVNPMSGCLPILLQIPIFFALYKVLFITIEMRHAPFFGWIQDLSAPDPTSVFNLFGLLPYEPWPILHVGVWPCLMLIGMLFQRKLNPPPQDPIQRDMALYMPILLTYMMANFAAGLVIYWTFSAYIGILQQVIIMRRLGVPIHLFDKDKEEEKLEKSVDEGAAPAVHPLVEMAEERVEEALFGDDGSGPDKPISPPKPKKKKKK